MWPASKRRFAVRSMFRFCTITVIALSAVLCRLAEAQSTTTLNIPLGTLGGEQLWSDQLVRGKWRIQRNELTGHCRLLDPADVRRAWGDEKQCRDELEMQKRNSAAPPLAGKAVITLHGLGRTRDHMNSLGKYLEKEGNYTWINMGYASTRASLDSHAESFARVVEGLEGIDEIYVVAHSLGNLVVRRYLGEASQPQPRWQPDRRIVRMVMIGPPNNGAQLARVAANLLNDNQFVRLMVGPSAWQLAREWEDAQRRLATPGFEFGIVAGGFGERGLNPLLEGDDDLVVTVAETRLPGATDFRLVNCRHSGLLYDPTVHQQTLRFLQHGCFTTNAERQPIPFLDAAQVNRPVE
jgi:pimeloyl-ACP methyl ester carboxylesterase